MQQLRAPIFEEKVVDHILSLVEVAETPVSKDELQKAIEALDERGRGDGRLSRSATFSPA